MLQGTLPLEAGLLRRVHRCPVMHPAGRCLEVGRPCAVLTWETQFRARARGPSDLLRRARGANRVRHLIRMTTSVRAVVSRRLPCRVVGGSAVRTRSARFLWLALVAALGVVTAWTGWAWYVLATDARGITSSLRELADVREASAREAGVPGDERRALEAEASAAQQIEAQVEMAIAQSFASVALLAVTGVYVALTYQLVREARTGHALTRSTIEEMQASRQQDLDVRRREKSEVAALRALAAIRLSGVRNGLRESRIRTRTMPRSAGCPRGGAPVHL